MQKEEIQFLLKAKQIYIYNWYDLYVQLLLHQKLFLILEMNGHGFFIWSAYGVWFVLLILLLFKVLLHSLLKLAGHH